MEGYAHRAVMDEEWLSPWPLRRQGEKKPPSSVPAGTPLR
jgi:hypothetical protein